MKADKKVRISVTVPKKEREQLRSFPYFASFMVSCLLEELFKRIPSGELVKELNASGGVEERLEKLRKCISAAFLAPGRGRKVERTSQAGGAGKTDFWKMIDGEGGNSK